MGRPPKNKQYSVRENVVNDIINNPEKYRIFENTRTIDLDNLELIKRLKKYQTEKEKESPLVKESVRVSCMTGIPLDVIARLIKGNETDPFKLKLNEKHLESIYPFFNDLLNHNISFEQFKELLKGEKYNTKYSIKKNRALSLLFKDLSDNGYICKEWQYQLEKLKLFTSRNGKELKASDFAKALSNTNKYGGATKEKENINELMQTLKKMDNNPK